MLRHATGVTCKTREPLEQPTSRDPKDNNNRLNNG
jgi:hypothetical protein